MDIKGLVRNLCKKYNTRDPFEIARQKDIILLYEPLGNINGFYSKTLRKQFIHINQDLDERQRHFTCCHELGHAILHPNLNTPFLREGTLLSVNKLEVQANKFAVDLMYSDSDLQEALNWTVEQTATWMGLPQRYAEYRILSVEPRLLPETP